MTTIPPAPTVSVLFDDLHPRAELVITPMPADAVQVTVWRYFDGARSLVRGGWQRPVTGDALVVDDEMPLDTTVTYSCQTVNDLGSPSPVSPQSAPVDCYGVGTWMQDPLDPASAIRIGIYRDYSVDSDTVAQVASFAQITRAAEGTVTTVPGSRLSVGNGGLRRGPSQIPLEIWTSGDDTPALRDLLDQANPVLLRATDDFPMLDRLTYLQIGDLTETYRRSDGTTIWAFTADAVMSPGAKVVRHSRTYLTVLDEASTYGDPTALYPTYLDLLRGP